MKNNNIFLFFYKRELYCYNCLYKKIKEEYLGPIIQMNVEDLYDTLSKCLYKRFQNNSLVYYQYGCLDEIMIKLSLNMRLVQKVLLKLKFQILFFSFMIYRRIKIIFLMY